MTGLDTSVVLRLLVGEPVEQAERARRYLDQLFENGDRAWISDLVASEVYFALQFHYSVPKERALDALRSLFESGEIVGIGSAPEILRSARGLGRAGPGFVDRLIHGDYSRNDGEMATFEKAAGRLDRVRVL